MYRENQVKRKPTCPSEEDKSKPLAFNSKFTDAAFKGLIGFRNNGRIHEFSYNLYRQMLGIVEDESLEAINNPGEKGRTRL